MVAVWWCLFIKGPPRWTWSSFWLFHWERDCRAVCWSMAAWLFALSPTRIFSTLFGLKVFLRLYWFSCTSFLSWSISLLSLACLDWVCFLAAWLLCAVTGWFGVFIFYLVARISPLNCPIAVIAGFCLVLPYSIYARTIWRQWVIAPSDKWWLNNDFEPIDLMLLTSWCAGIWSLYLNATVGLISFGWFGFFLYKLVTVWLWVYLRVQGQGALPMPLSIFNLKVNRLKVRYGFKLLTMMNPIPSFSPWRSVAMRNPIELCMVTTHCHQASSLKLCFNHPGV